MIKTHQSIYFIDKIIIDVLLKFVFSFGCILTRTEPLNVQTMDTILGVHNDNFKCTKSECFWENESDYEKS